MYREKIESYIDSHRQEMIEDISALCRINSEKMPYSAGKPYGEGAFAALNAALDMAERYGFSVNNYDNYVGTADLNDGPAQLDILAHLDVVPAGEGWTVTEPFEPVEKDGKLYGRGTADDKGPAVAALYAMRCVKDLGIPLTKNVRLILGTDEECGSSDIEHYYDVEKEAPMTFSPDGEFPVVNIEKGRLEGHFDSSFEASEALPKLVSFSSGTKANVVPGKAEAILAGLEAEEIEKEARQVEQETGIRFTLSVRGNPGAGPGRGSPRIHSSGRKKCPDRPSETDCGTASGRLPAGSCGSSPGEADASRRHQRTGSGGFQVR